MPKYVLYLDTNTGADSAALTYSDEVSHSVTFLRADDRAYHCTNAAANSESNSRADICTRSLPNRAAYNCSDFESQCGA
eukprot:gene14147-16271_t